MAPERSRLCAGAAGADEELAAVRARFEFRCAGALFEDGEPGGSELYVVVRVTATTTADEARSHTFLCLHGLQAAVPRIRLRLLGLPELRPGSATSRHP